MLNIKCMSRTWRNNGRWFSWTVNFGYGQKCLHDKLQISLQVLARVLLSRDTIARDLSHPEVNPFFQRASIMRIVDTQPTCSIKRIDTKVVLKKSKFKEIAKRKKKKNEQKKPVYKTHHTIPDWTNETIQ